MKSFLAALLVAILVPSYANSQTRPDFSGTWKMDPSRSESAAQTEPVGPITLVIAQTPSELKISTTRSPGATEVVTYRLDGSETKIPGGTAKTRWEGSTLVTEVERYVQGQAVSTKETRTLAAAGDEMVVQIVLVVQHGYSATTTNYGKGKDVYVRSR